MKFGMLLFVLGVFFIVSCNVNNDSSGGSDSNSDFNIPDGFDFATTKEITADITVLLTGGEAVGYANVSVLYDNSHTVFSAFSNAQGKISGLFSVPAYVTEVQLLSKLPGLPDTVTVSLSNNTLSYVYNSESEVVTGVSSNMVVKAANLVSGFYTLGTWDSKGRPNYLTNSDVIRSSFLADVGASLPEGTPLTVTHPQYLTSNASATIHLEKDCDVWVTFVHEGAGYKNVLGFYTYADGNAPATANAIDKKTIIFPNVSYPGSGGNLSSGSKVHLGTFTANTNIEWFLVADGFRSSTSIANSPMYYSNDNFNPETAADKKKHVVVLYDTNRDLALLSFEDLNRQGGSDDDFNDAIFYVTSNPIEAIDKTQYVDRGQIVDTPVDSDNDGVTDTFDDFPNDPARAKLVESDTYSTLAFEDYWPSKGDYDFNDLVLDYKYDYVTNSSNQVKDIKPTFVIKAVGAAYQNGFGVQFPFASSVVAETSGQKLTKGLTSSATNGMETGQSKAVMIVFDDVFGAMSVSGSSYINTERSGTTMDPYTISMNVTLQTAQTLTETAPFNPFIFTNGDRTKEIHLANHKPTDLANTSYLGTKDDKSNAGTGIYYLSTGNLPWAINITGSFSYPLETKSVTDAYNYFIPWAESGGNSYADWYLNLSGYRNSSLIY